MVPLQPPKTFEHMTKYLLVSIALPLPTKLLHQESTSASPVKAWHIKMALSLLIFKCPEAVYAIVNSCIEAPFSNLNALS